MKSNHDVLYTWKQSWMGGGGYITGVLQDPVNTDILYARCDVAGMFKSTDRGRSWKSVNNGMCLCHHHSVQSFAINPLNPEVLLRCSGEARGKSIFGTIHKSIDAGESWYEVCSDINYYGNGPTRMCGEVIAFHPSDPDIVVTGGYSNGVWISRDGGEEWNYSALKGERITCIMIHPALPNVIYAATTGDTGLAALKEYGLESFHDFPRGDRGKLYRSSDTGGSWQLMAEGFNFSQLVLHPGDPDIICAACMQDGLQKSTDSGKSWENIGNSLPRDYEYKVITSDHKNPSVLYSIPNLSGHREGVDPIAVYKSVDTGRSWFLVKEHDDSDLSLYPHYMSIYHVGWAVSKLLVDLKDSQRLYMSNWYGVSISEDGGRTWCGNNFNGTETICAESVVCHPKEKGKVYITLADHAPLISSDYGKTYGQIETIQPYINSTAFVASRHREDLLVYGARNRHGNRECCIIRSEDEGNTVEIVKQFGPRLFVQALAEDFHRPGRFFAYVDGSIDSGAGLYRSDDWGREWVPMNFGISSNVKSLPHEQYWVDAELLSVVVYQVKNACGSNQLLCTDPFREDTLYVGERTEGLFVTNDCGITWIDIGKQIPFKRRRSSVLNVVKADETRPGVLYAGFIREGLWRSENFGQSWEKVFPKDDSICNASSIALGGQSGDEIFIASEPLYWSPCPSGVYYSHDRGASWRDIHDKSLGAIRWKGIAVEKSTGIVLGVSCGNGCFYAEPIRNTGYSFRFLTQDMG
mgnify:CR=1 FL=1